LQLASGHARTSSTIRNKQHPYVRAVRKPAILSLYTALALIFVELLHYFPLFLSSCSFRGQGRYIYMRF
jgi:hypothetical protein